jgi:hypothetical protein
MADVTVANTAPGISGKTLACHDADGTTTGIWTFASPLALRGVAPTYQTWRLSVDGAGVLHVAADGSSTYLSVNQAGDIYEKGRTNAALGHWIAVPFDAANFTASPGSWTVEAGDVAALAYMLVGKTLSLVFQLISTSVGGAPTELRIALPAALQAAYAFGAPAFSFQDSAVGIGCTALNGGAAFVALRRDIFGSAVWPASTNGTHVTGCLTIPIL